MPTSGPTMRATTVRVSIDAGSSRTVVVTAVAATQPTTYAVWCCSARLAAPLRVSRATRPAATTSELKVPPEMS